MSAVDDKRQLGWGSAAGLVIANMLGAGVFTQSGFLLRDLGTVGNVMIVWILGGVLAMLGALCYGALGRHIPKSGGEYRFLSDTLHPSLGYVAGWISLSVGFSAPIAASALAFGEYLTPDEGPRYAARWLGTLLMACLAAAHALHVRRGAWIQNVAVLIKLTLILLFIGAGVSKGLLAPGNPATSEALAPPGLGTFAKSLVWVSFSYAGWNAAVYLGGEIRDPARNLPKALLIGTATVTLLYVGLNLVFLAPVDAVRGELEIARIAAEWMFGGRVGLWVNVLIALAMATSVSAMIMAGPRVYEAMARDHHLPRWFSAGSAPPKNAILLQFLLSAVLMWTATFEILFTYIGFTLSISSALTVVGLVRLRFKIGSRIAIPGWPVVPSVFVALVLAMTAYTVSEDLVGSGIGLATIAIGFLGWRLSSRG